MTVVITGTASDTLAAQNAYQLSSMTDLLAELRARLRDPSAASGRWTDAELYWCIKAAIRTLTGQVHVLGSISDVFTDNERTYELPGYVRTVLQVRRGPILDGIVATDGKLVPVLSYRHFRTLTTNTLSFENTYAGGLALEIDFTMTLQVPPSPTTLAAEVLTSSADEFDVVGASHTWPLPGYFLCESELCAYTGASAGVLTGVSRGLFGSTAIGHSVATTVDPVLPLEHAHREAVILGALTEAHRLRLEDGPQSDTSGELTRYQLARQVFEEARTELVSIVVPAQLPVWKNMRRTRGPVVR